MGVKTKNSLLNPPRVFQKMKHPPPKTCKAYYFYEAAIKRLSNNHRLSLRGSWNSEWGTQRQRFFSCPLVNYQTSRILWKRNSFPMATITLASSSTVANSAEYCGVGPTRMPRVVLKPTLTTWLTMSVVTS